MNTRFLFATLGHTAAGKTTLSKYLLNDNAFGLIYIEEGNIKRQLVGNYTTKDSLNEELRDMAYSIAINQADNYLYKNDVLIDASFHRLERRSKLYTMVKENPNIPKLIWLYCYCPNINKVQQRISKRKTEIKKAETQADSMNIYNHIINTFNTPIIDEIPNDIQGAIIYINTDSNEIERIEYNKKSFALHNKVEFLCQCIRIQEQTWRKLQ